MKIRAFTLIELLAVTAITVVLGVVAAGAGWKVYEQSSLAVSANNIRQLNAGAQAYLSDHNFKFWRYQEAGPAENPGTKWWFGFETAASKAMPEGQRRFDAAEGPLGGYLPAGLRPDPSFALNGRAFKPKYRSGYLGVGYNVLLGGGWAGNPASLKTYWSLNEPDAVVVFFTSAQVNTFQRPASAANPMLEEFYGIDDREVTAHFRHHGYALVGFANGAAGFLPTTKTEANDKGVKITVADAKGAEKTLEADLVLVAIGVAPVLPGGALKIGLTDRGYIQTNDRYETTVPGVYAAGDIIGPPWLAHVASYEAIQAVEGMFVPGSKPKKVTLFPGCTYCHPQVASIGLTERAAKEKGLKFKIGKFPFMASGKARAIGETDGFVKLIVGEPHGEILGAHIIGADATEMLAELGLAINSELTLDDIHATIHAHPTLSESVHEAALVAEGHGIHT